METLDPIYAARRPRVTPEEAGELAARHWGWVGGSARELPSERDRVFEIARPDGERAVLKVSNGLERASALASRAQELEALSTADLPWRFPAPIPTVQGDPHAEVEVDGGRHFARLLSRVPGRPLDEVRGYGAQLLREVGRMLGAVDRVLEGLPEPDEVRPHVWDLRSAAERIERHLDDVAGAGSERRGRLEAVLERVEAVVRPRTPELRLRRVHNDANPANLRVEVAGPGEGPTLVGLVDFGDAVHSWAVSDLAVACAYAGFGRPDPVAAFCHVARGYTSERPLSEAEADVVCDLARLRAALSVTVAAVRSRQEPENRYLELSRDAAWALLERLDEGPADLARYRLREACGHPPCPDGPRVVAALAGAAAGAGPVLDPDPREASILTVDLSVATGPDGGTFDPTDHTAFTRALFRRMADAGAEIGIGRYDEARWWYTGDAFRAPGLETDEWRTVHLGVDLFAEPGTPVLAPLAGRVVDLADNDQRLDYGPTVILEHELADDDGPVRFWTLWGHLAPDVLDRLEAGRRLEAGEPFATIGAPPRNGDWAPHLHLQLIVDRLGYEGTFPGVAAPSQRETWLALSPDPNLLLRLPAGTAAPRPPGVDGLREARGARLGPSLGLSYDRPLHIVRGRGAYLYDAEGQPHLDVVNNVAHVGHAHPRVVEAACRQMGLLETNTRYLHEAILAYTERLLALFPEPLDVCYLVCSGTEASELALRMARTYAGKVGAIVLEAAYHGNSSSVINLSPYKFDGPGGKGVRPWVRVVPMPDVYRGRYREDVEDPGARYAAHVPEALASLNEEKGPWGGPPPGAAAFFHESILGCGGQIPLPPGYLPAAYEAVRTAGAVCVADEVQTGFGRVGTHFWAFEEHGVVPDVVTLGKPMGNGHPLAAVVTTRAIADAFDNGMEYFNTFGGNPVSCEVGLAVLDIVEEERLQEHAARAGGRLLGRLEELRERHEAIGDVRGRGLFLGVELVRDRETREPAPGLARGVVQRMRDRRVLLSTDGPDHNVIKMKPPLVFSETDADRLCAELDEVLRELSSDG